MYAMALVNPGEPLQPIELPRPEAGAGQALIEVGACGVCRTDLHMSDIPSFPYRQSEPYARSPTIPARSYLLLLRFAVFAVGLAIATAKVWRCSYELNAVRSSDGALYLLTGNNDWRGDQRPGDDCILRITAAED